jgi:hypothetical protein
LRLRTMMDYHRHRYKEVYCAVRMVEGLEVCVFAVSDHGGSTLMILTRMVPVRQDLDLD